MKRILKYLATACLVASLFLSANSQNIKFGVFVDPQLSWFTSDTKKLTPNGPVFGVNAGFAFEKYFADRYAITSGASINFIGGNLKYNEPDFKIETRDSLYTIGTDASAKIKGQYITIPLGFKFKTNEIGYETFYAQLGLAGNIRIKGYVWEDWNKIDKEVVVNEQLPLGFVSYYFGAGVEYSLGGPSAIQLGLTFSNGLTSAFDVDHEKTAPSNGKITLGALSLRVGMSF